MIMWLRLWWLSQKLFSDSNSECEQATASLVAIGRPAVPKLRAILRADNMRYKALLAALDELGEPIRYIPPNEDKNTRACCAAAKALGDIGDPAAVEDLVEALVHPHWWVRRDAARALGRIGDSRTLPSLVASLQHDADDIFRGEAAYALGDLRDAGAVDALLEALKPVVGASRYDHGDSLRGSVLFSLIKIRSPRAVAWLVTNHLDKCECQEAIVKFGDVAVPSLRKALTRKNWWARREAALALSEIGGDASVEPLVFALADESDEVRVVAGEALVRQKWRPKTAEQRLQLAIACLDVAAMVKQGDRALDALIERLQRVPETGEGRDRYTTTGNDKVKDAVASALGEIGGERALAALLADLHAWPSPATVRALGRLSDGRAVEPLVNLLRPETLTNVRLPGGGAYEYFLLPDVMRALGQIRDPRVIRPLLAALNDKHEFHELRSAAAEALGNLAQPKGVSHLLRAAANGESGASVVLALIRILKRAATKVSTEELLAAAQLTRAVEFAGADQYDNSIVKQVDCSQVRQLARQELVRRGLRP